MMFFSLRKNYTYSSIIIGTQEQQKKKKWARRRNKLNIVNDRPHPFPDAVCNTDIHLITWPVLSDNLKICSSFFWCKKMLYIYKCIWVKHKRSITKDVNKSKKKALRYEIFRENKREWNWKLLRVYKSPKMLFRTKEQKKNNNERIIRKRGEGRNKNKANAFFFELRDLL